MRLLFLICFLIRPLNGFRILSYRGKFGSAGSQVEEEENLRNYQLFSVYLEGFHINPNSRYTSCVLCEKDQNYSTLETFRTQGTLRIECTVGYFLSRNYTKRLMLFYIKFYVY